MPGLEWTTVTKRSWSGSRAAISRRIRVLTRRHVPAMVRLARRILGNTAEAEDVVQEAMLRVWTHAPRWQPLAAFKTWLTRVVVNLCLDRKRRDTVWSIWKRPARSVDPRPARRIGRSRRTRAPVRDGYRQASRPPAHRDRAHLQRGPEQCAGGAISGDFGFGGGDFTDPRQAEFASRARGHSSD